MKKLVAVATLGTVLIGAWPLPARASAAVDAALALGAFAVFSQLFLWPALVRPVYAAPPTVVYASPPAAAVSPPAASDAPASRVAAIRGEFVYPHGRYVLLGDGVTVAYRWVWVPNPPAGPPPPPPR